MTAPTDTRTLPSAVLDGGPAPELPVCNLGEALQRAAARPDAGRIHFVRADGSDTVLEYPELLDGARRILTGLRAGGARPGDRVLLQIREESDLLAAFWAAVLGGLVPIPVPPGRTDAPEAAAQQLEWIWAGYQHPWVVVGDDGAAASPAMAEAGSWLGRTGELRGHAPAEELHPARADDLAVLLLTSGSTGVPKAVALTHRNILARSTATAEVRRLDVTSRSFNWMPLDHIGGLVMFHARDVLLGCTQVHARTEWILADPTRWFEQISRHGCDTTWAPNFAFGLVNDRAEEIAGRDWDLRSLRYIMNGGESVKARVIRRFLDLLAPFGLPRTSMHPGWGMSETSAGIVDFVFDPDTMGDERFVPVGRPHPGVLLRVVDEHDGLLPAGTVGRLQVAGAPVFSGYYENPEQNAKSFTEDGWFRSGDLAVIEDGILTVTGRVDDLITLNGAEYHGHEIEALVEELPFVEPSFTIVSPCTAAGGEEELVVFYHPRGTAGADEADRRIRDLVTERYGVRLGGVVTLAREDVPKTGIGKLRRAELRKRYEAGTPGGPGTRA
ncbi:acyl-CoA synthetase (AMP-forming)/AMP-acid ligase II [Streptomyces sp. TLI_235]|nr:AMP-binding protein [Streptomyces sp. TLI_235]PBC78702.1 acyl-CoA synthetase (AMP-forming)/AMP-acid ligase II [Streptomyces sp. TLI_235]